MSERKLETKIIEEKSVVLRACGDYVAFHEMSLYVEYVYGECSNMDIFENITECSNISEEDKKLVLDIWNENKIPTADEQKTLDNMVDKFLENYEGDYCDYEAHGAIKVDNRIYVSL
jgi:uncharacterized protein YheU (UPF0270 family)